MTGHWPDATLRPVRDILRAKLTEALEWLADDDDRELILPGYSVAALADHLSAIMCDDCWGCTKRKHSLDARICALGRQNRVVPIGGRRGSHA